MICENPIHSLKLLNKLGIKKKLLSLHDHNEQNLIKRIAKYQYKSSIALISDAGSPLISDPGYKLVLDYIKKNIMITCIPGPTSAIVALQISGLPINNFTFLGFISKNRSGNNATFEYIRNSFTTSILFVPGNKLINFLDELVKNKIKRRVAICKELTKINEKVFRGEISEVIKILNSSQKNLKGEFVVVIEGKKKIVQNELSPEIKGYITKLLTKFSLTEVVQIVHKLTNISKKEVYKTALSIKND